MALKRKRIQTLRPLKRTKRMTTRRLPLVKLVRSRTRRTLATRPNKAGIIRDRRMATLRYFVADTVNINATYQTLQFRANGCFDPEIAVGGHQPRGFDQWMVLYQNFAVTNCTIAVRVSTRTGKEACMVSIVTTEAGTANDASQTDAFENNPRTTRVGHWHPDGGRVGFVKSAVNIAKFTNAHAGIADDIDLHGNVASDPIKAVTFNVNLTNAGALGVGTSDILTTLTYRVMFLQPNKFGQS